jgi:DNA mismatch repair protein MutS
MRQYLDLKEKHADALLFFRCGDFYELFFEDAVTAARALDLTLTSRDKGKEDAVPMAGVPYHAVRGYLARLTELGFKVAICEQMEDPKLAKGLVKREIVRVITPGVVLDDDVLDPKLPRYLAALVPAGKKGNPAVGLAYLDATTGELCATELPLSAVLDELVRVGPREVLADAAQLDGMLAPVRARYKAPWNPADVPALDAAVKELGPLLKAAGSSRADAAIDRAVIDPDERPLAVRAAATVLAYARATQPTGTLPVTRVLGYEPGDAVVLDETAIANLELTETLIGKKKQGALLDVIDQTVTAPGGRMLRRWLLYPLIDVAQIRRRQDAVAWLVARPALLEQVRRTLSRVADLERLAGKATLGVATPRDLGRLRDALAMLPEVIALVKSGATGPASGIDPLPELFDLGAPASAGALPGGLAACADPALPALAARLGKALVDEPPYLLKDGNVIRAGYDAQVDECRRLADGGKDEILAIEAREQKDSGIANLKVRYNRVFGYYLEITKSQLAKVPAHYIRKQTIANGERFVTPELAELERKVVTAEETLASREAELFKAEVAAVAELAGKVSAASAALAVVDACASLAEVAARRGYCRPVVNDDLVIDIVDGRHPVIEAMLPDGTFVPNDCKLDPAAEQLVLITGPNMAGKSTYMRQVAQIALLAQIGSFVPAKSATIGVCDRVFTRVGAADNLSRGDSTFMVEMRETAAILAHATRRSLVVLDEVGRGTSTFDGVSIAWAVAEHIHDQVGARTLFATHYHELVALADSRPRVRNVSVAVREHKGEIVFLRRVVPGGANKSYGIDVARLAGLPAKVIGRAREIMSRLEGGSALGTSAQLSLGAVLAPQVPLAAPPSPIASKLAAIDINRMTPLEALTLLAELKALA